MKIKIKKSQTADTRNCDWSKVTKYELIKATEQHQEDVIKGLYFLMSKLSRAAFVHDVTKIVLIDEFYKDFQSGFETKDWWEKHQQSERHHFNNEKYIQEDVNLIDILEQIVDGVMAAMARSGQYKQEKLPDGLLEKAYNNTVKLLLDNVEVEQ